MSTRAGTALSPSLWASHHYSEVAEHAAEGITGPKVHVNLPQALLEIAGFSIGRALHHSHPVSPQHTKSLWEREGGRVEVEIDHAQI